MIEWIVTNKEWFFSGVGVLILGCGINFLKKKSNESTNNTVDFKSNSNTVHVNVLRGDQGQKDNLSKKNDALTKESIQILFIDDEKFKTVDNLRTAGYLNTKTIKDVRNLDSIDLKNANVIFVDINGVGETLFPVDKGLGLAEAIKKKYPDKHVVIYSAQEQGNRFHKALKCVDYTLPKNAEPYEFINIIENFCNEDIN
ncbi:response regulator [uncultured Dysgonomonas sp.]|uniref:response regulator n=1 Tax=uncultured Dysgonomonas sp. TaxID=206096 RepID=UPI002805CC2B|nr:response regulator [uncultured Dysgonomonas sp.]